jgi:Holliday junction DNA helicase RuvA
MGAEALATAIATGDVEALTRGSGVGRKTASRLVLELKGKLEREGLELPAERGGDEREVVAALMALGYSAREAGWALSSLGSTPGLSLEERLRRALQQLAGR